MTLGNPSTHHNKRLKHATTNPAEPQETRKIYDMTHHARFTIFLVYNFLTSKKAGPPPTKQFGPTPPTCILLNMPLARCSHCLRSVDSSSSWTVSLEGFEAKQKWRAVGQESRPIKTPFGFFSWFLVVWMFSFSSAFSLSRSLGSTKAEVFVPKGLGNVGPMTTWSPEQPNGWWSQAFQTYVGRNNPKRRWKNMSSEHEIYMHASHT